MQGEYALGSMKCQQSFGSFLALNYSLTPIHSEFKIFKKACEVKVADQLTRSVPFGDLYNPRAEVGVISRPLK